MSLSKSSEAAGSFKSFKTVLAIVFLLFVFSSDMISEVRQIAKSRTVTATIINRDQTCRLTVYHPDKTKTRKTLPCNEAYALKFADESRKTHIYKRTYVTLNYTLANGTQRTARVSEKRVRARNKPIGSQIKVAYNTRNPALVTAPKSWLKTVQKIIFVVVGLMILMVFVSGYQKIQSLVELFKKAMEESAQKANTRRRRAEEAMARIEDNFAPESVPAALGSSKTSSTKSRKSPRPSRQRKKVAPIPTTGGVVSKRRRGLFG